MNVSQLSGIWCEEQCVKNTVYLNNFFVSSQLFFSFSPSSLSPPFFFFLFWFFLYFYLQSAPVGVVGPSDVLQQHPHPSAGFQSARSSLPHRLTRHTPCTHPTHTSSHPPFLSSSVPCSAFHDGNAVPLPSQSLKKPWLQM